MRVRVLTISALCWMRADPTLSEDALGNELSAADGTAWTASATDGGEPVAAVHARRPELIRGLITAFRKRKSPAEPPYRGNRVTDRPVYADDVVAGGGVNATDDTGETDGTIATAGPERIVFGTEDECVSATGDERRPCVCHTVDYLGWVAQRLDDAVAGDEPVAARAFDCQSYKAVPASFVVRPSGDADRPRPDDSPPAHVAPTQEDDGPALGTARAEVVPVKVISYRLNGPANGNSALRETLTFGSVFVSDVRSLKGCSCTFTVVVLEVSAFKKEKKETIQQSSKTRVRRAIAFH